MKNKLKVGDYIYCLNYYNHPFNKSERSLSKRRINEIRNNKVIFANNEFVSLKSIDDFSIDEWYSSKKLMYHSKLANYIKSYGQILNEIRYLKRKLKQCEK